MEMDSDKFEAFVAGVAAGRSDSSSQNARSGRVTLGASLLRFATLSGLFVCPDCSLTVTATSLDTMCDPGVVRIDRGISERSGGYLYVVGKFQRHPLLHSENLRPNRAVPAGNTPVTDGQSRRVDTSKAVMLKPARLKMSWRPYDVTTTAAVNHAGVTARGLWLVASGPRDSRKAPSDSHFGNRRSEADRLGLLCNRL